MSIREEANELHLKGFNCAQSVLCANCKNIDLDEKTALAISGGMGGGVRCGEICGAATGAVMAIGMANPYTDGNDADAKATIAQLTVAFIKEFKEKFGCVRCVELKAKGVSCKELIECSAEIAERIILNRR